MAIVIGTVVLLSLLYGVVVFNALTRLKNTSKEAFATMDVYLKRRWDLIPTMVEVVKGYAEHELAALVQVTSLRGGVYQDLSQDGKIEANERLEEGMLRLFAVVENYPDLKADSQFLELNKTLAAVENDLANARKYYNGVIRNLNNKVQMFPSNIVAGLFGFKTEKMFEIQDAERANIEVKF